MEQHRGHFRDAFNHPDILVAMDGAFASGAQSILSYFENEIRRGTVFRSGETIQIGWMIVSLARDDDGELEVLEPQFGTVPVQWVRGATTTYRHLMLQNEVCRQVGVDPEFPSMQQAGVISPGFLDAVGPFQITREKQNTKDSGWIFREASYSGSDGIFCSLYEIGAAVRSVIPFLALPPGSTVKRLSDRLTIGFGGKLLDSYECAFLSRLLSNGDAN